MRKVEREWIIVGFEHPTQSRSIIYKKCKRIETLQRYIQDGIEAGCNLFSIRGNDIVVTYGPDSDPEQQKVGC